MYSLKRSGLFVAALFVVSLGAALGAILGAILALSAPAEAFETRKFDARSFKAVQQADKPILIDVGASWCAVCKAQRQALQQLGRKPEYTDFVVFEIDFDSQKSAANSFDARHQSTLIAFKGETETGRLVGDARPDSLKALLSSATAR